MRKSTQLRASMRGSALQTIQMNTPIKIFLELDVSELSEISGVSEVLERWQRPTECETENKMKQAGAKTVRNQKRKRNRCKHSQTMRKTTKLRASMRGATLVP